MSRCLDIAIRFLSTTFHGRRDGGEPEWPPSPLRVFQALVAAAAARWNERILLSHAVPALEWLEKQPAPAVVAAVGVPSSVKYRLYVPNNAADLVAAAWKRGNANASIADHRTEKDVRPTHLAGDAVHYLYPIADAVEFAQHKETLVAAARSVTHLGWGVDVVAGNATEMTAEEVANLAGERWQPTGDGSGTQLRVPRKGTLQALMGKHTAFLNRLSGDGFKPVPPLTAFDVVGYARETDLVARPWVAFRISSVDPDDANPSFDTPRRCSHVAAWVRHATASVCDGWPFDNIVSFVHGHDTADNSKQLKGENADHRFMYLPLPSIERRGDRGTHVGSIRRALIAAPVGCGDRIAWLRQRLPGHELIWDERPVGLLTELPRSDWVLGRYTGESRVWSTVTPVVWPAHDDRDRGKAERVLRKAFVDAGVSQQLVDGIVELAWRPVGFRAGVDLALRYDRPEKVTGPRYHVRVRFAHPVRGPLAVGAGRYRGLGLFAAESS